MAAKDNFFSIKKTLKIRGKVFDLIYPRVMGIINLTPDSFYLKSRHTNKTDIIKYTEQLVKEGVDIVDLGAYSSRPGADDISENEEWRRLEKGLKAIKREFSDLIISIDTFRSGIAKNAIGEGADIINDISGGDADKLMFQTIADLQVPYILMHMRGTPKNMVTLTDYEDLLFDLIKFFEMRIRNLNQLGHNDIIIDPGIGFSKSVGQNYEILKNLDYFKVLKLPLLIGVSRKSLIYKKLGVTAEEALNGTSILHTIALQKGVSFLRVHDVKEAAEVAKLVKLISN